MGWGEPVWECFWRAAPRGGPPPCCLLALDTYLFSHLCVCVFICDCACKWPQSPKRGRSSGPRIILGCDAYCGCQEPTESPKECMCSEPLSHLSSLGEIREIMAKNERGWDTHS